jgi:hypothetical protein
MALSGVIFDNKGKGLDILGTIARYCATSRLKGSFLR